MFGSAAKLTQLELVSHLKLIIKIINLIKAVKIKHETLSTVTSCH